MIPSLVLMPPLLLSLTDWVARLPAGWLACKQIYLTLWDVGVYRNGFSICDEISMREQNGGAVYRIVLLCA